MKCCGSFFDEADELPLAALINFSILHYLDKLSLSVDELGVNAVLLKVLVLAHKVKLHLLL